MRLVLWTVGMGLCGFLIGGIGGLDRGSLIGAIWGAGIGYGFGTIFEQKHATIRIIVYWIGTMALVGPFFGLLIGAALLPNGTSLQDVVAGIIGAVLGMLFGLLVGTIQFKRLRRRSQTCPSS